MRIRNNRNLKARLFIIVLILFAIILILYGLTKEETKTYELCKNFKQEYYDFGSERISIICKINGEEKLISLFPNRSNIYIKETKKEPYVEFEGRYWRPKISIFSSWSTDIRYLYKLKKVTIYIPEGTEL